MILSLAVVDFVWRDVPGSAANKDAKMLPLPVLVVEDSFLLAASLEDALLEAGHQVTLAGSLAEAEAVMANTDFHAALLDFMLPDGDSLVLARRLHEKGCSVAVVSGADRDVVPADPAISAHFAKPMDDRVLVDWIASLPSAQQDDTVSAGFLASGSAGMQNGN